MNRRCIAVMAALVTFFCATTLHAQLNGCSDSPENPTVVLAVVGGAGALFSTVRARLRARKR